VLYKKGEIKMLNLFLNTLLGSGIVIIILITVIIIKAVIDELKKHD
jgi:hypothetical protein